MIALIRSELVKARTTKLWWGFAITLFLLCLPALGFVILQMEVYYQWGESGEASEDLSRQVVTGVYTAGQYFGLLFTALFGTLLVTNEYQHRTASATYLAVPNRTRVVLAKITVAALAGAMVWAATTLLDLLVGTGYLALSDLDPQLDDSLVSRVIGANLLAHLLWAVLGVGIGAVIRNQVGALVMVIVLYMVTGFAADLLVILSLANKAEWLTDLAVLFPSYASQLLTRTDSLFEMLPGAVPWWVGGMVLTAYAMLAATLGILATGRRDVS